jgi:hypothetical protein
LSNGGSEREASGEHGQPWSDLVTAELEKRFTRDVDFDEREVTALVDADDRCRYQLVSICDDDIERVGTADDVHIRDCVALVINKEAASADLDAVARLDENVVGNNPNR